MGDPALVALCAGGLVSLLAGARTIGRRKPVQHTHLRGRFLRPAGDVEQLLSHLRATADPGLHIGRQLFPSSTATRHIAFVGTTGSGKTLLQRLLMQSALAHVAPGKNHRALIYDAKQDLLSLLAGIRPQCPIHLFNPLDARSVSWNMAVDITSPAAALQVASTLIPQPKNDANPFFSNAARHLLYGVLLALIERAPSRWTLRHVLLLLRDVDRLHVLLSHSESTHHLLQYFGHPTTLQNIFSTVLTYTAPHEIIAACWDRATGSLSLREWLNQESILVLGNDEQNRAALDTINRLVFRRVAELALAGPEVGDERLARRTWFFLDEVREAGKLDLLSRLLTKGRSKGCAVVLGFQDISGMREAYGREITDELLGQCNTKVLLRLNSPETAAWAAKLFGDREVLERRRGRSRTHRMSFNGESSSGVSVSHSVVRLPVVLDSEILGLPETSRKDGLTALYTNPATGLYSDHIPSSWLNKSLCPPDPKTLNFIPRPDSHQYLRPWNAEDDELIGFSEILRHAEHPERFQ